MKKETAEILVELILRLDADSDHPVRDLLETRLQFCRGEEVESARRELVEFLINQD